MKKFLSLVLALVMALSLTTVAWGVDVATEAEIPTSPLADGTTITLTDNVALTATWEITVNGAATLDLGGKTLTGRINLTQGALTIKNGTINGNGGQALNVYGSATAAQNYSVLTVNSDVEVTNFSHGIVVFGPVATSTDGNGAVVNLYGTVDGTGVGVFVSGNLGNAAGAAAANNVVNIYGTINTTAQGVAMCGAATVNVYDGASITGSEAVGVKRGTLNVYGGYLAATGAYVDPATANLSGTEATGAAISVTSTYNNFGDIDINVEGGTIQSTNGVALYVGHSTNGSTATPYTNGADIDVSDGNFIGAEADVYVAPAITGDSTTYPEKFISGGTFSEDVSAYAAPSLSVVPDGFGGFTTAPTASVPTGSSSKPYFTTDFVNFKVAVDCNLADYKYELIHYYNGSDAAKMFDKKVIVATDENGAKYYIYESVVAASPASATLAFVNGSEITYLNTVETNWGGKVTKVDTVDFDDVELCGDVFTKDDVAVYKNDAGNLFVENKNGVPYNVGGKLVKLIPAATATIRVDLFDDTTTFAANTVYTIGHIYKYDAKTVNGANIVTKVYCSECKDDFAFVQGYESEAIAKFKAGNYEKAIDFAGDKDVWVAKDGTSAGGSVNLPVTLPSVGGSSTTPSTDKNVVSADTFDAGIAMYVGMSVMAAAGSAVVIGKKKD